MGQVVRAKVRALNDQGWGEYGPPNSDGFKMQSEPSQAVGLTNGTVTQTSIDLFWTSLTTFEQTGGQPIDKYQV